MEMEMIESEARAAAGVEVTAGAENLLERLSQAVEALERAVSHLTAKGQELSASATAREGRRTVPAAVTHLLSKQGVSLEALGTDDLQLGALDAALGSLSLEQRIAVKAQLMRAGVLGN